MFSRRTTLVCASQAVLLVKLETFSGTNGDSQRAVCLLGDSVDYKLSKTEILRGFIAEKLTTAAQEIFAVVERTVAGYEEEASGLRQEIDRQRRQLEAVLQPRVSLCRTDVEDSWSCDVLGHIEEEAGEDGGQESAEEPVQSTSLDEEDLGDPDHQITNTRGQCVKRKRSHLNLRVCLLEDSQTTVLTKGVLKHLVQDLRCDRGLQENDFLDLLRSTFPQLTGHFDVFTTDTTRTLTPLKLNTLTPEEIQRSIQSIGKGRSALYIRAKRKDEAVNDTSNDKNRPHASSHNNPQEKVEVNKADRVFNSRWQQVEAEKNKEYGISDDFSALSSACSAAERDDDDDVDDEVEEDDGDEEWKPDKKDEELRESDTEQNSSKTMTKPREVEHSGVITKKRKQVQSSLKASTDQSDAPLSCKVCQALRGSMNMLIKHAWSHVDDPERLCGVCGEHPESVEELRSHLQSHQKTHRCNVCGKSFLTVVGLNRHATLHRGERPYKCDVCHKAYTNNFTLKTHRWKHVEDKPHKCDVCNQSFAFTQQLRVHSRTHTGEKPYSCDVCGKSVGDLRSLSRHKLGHTGEKRYSCQVCGKQFLTPGIVKEHEKIHTEREKTYLCDICCKMFPTRGQLKVHLKSHSKEKIMCSECGKGLSSQGALKRHMLIHTGERPYGCSECGRTFNKRSILRAHLTTHSVIKPFVCGVCGKGCARKEYLKVHMRTHNGEKPYQCTVCDKAFTQSHCLKTHMKSHQREEQPV
ncbi:zinc finger protein 2-like isoform X2 [Micropterus salmoides]|uniref:zinc finger protein 2-like isoform X2 n=1 Tax=Micropterus salmoides TaxID=27706 RepID=UPI0018EBF3B9|nr:zinc finger protein 2-like isoform X2 [Micropterus salmoides]